MSFASREARRSGAMGESAGTSTNAGLMTQLRPSRSRSSFARIVSVSERSRYGLGARTISAMLIKLPVRGGDNGRDVRRNSGVFALFEVGEVFYVPLRPAYRRVVQARERIARRGEKFKHFVEHPLVYGPVSHDALLPDVGPAGLELRLDKADALALRLQKRVYGGQDEDVSR